jgi:signal transduction histidine kinase
VGDRLDNDRGALVVRLTRVRAASLAALVVLLTLVGSSCVLAVAASLLRGTGRTTAPVWQVVLDGAPAALVLGLMAASGSLVAARLWRRVRGQARTVDALALRVRMADDAAEHHRRTAENASAGVFELLSGLVAAEEATRGQLAAELHDTVAQSLSTARMMLDNGSAESASRAGELISEAEEQVRAVMARTRPPALREGDLAAAVASLRDDLRNRYGLEVRLVWPPEAYPLPLVTAVTVYRFFQEAMLNVVKHADIDAASASLRVDAEDVIAIVSDSGLGFDPASVHSEGGRHVGLGLLRERARLAGGSLEIVSYRNGGTTLTLRLPRLSVPPAGVLPSHLAQQPVSAPAG